MTVYSAIRIQSVSSCSRGKWPNTKHLGATGFHSQSSQKKALKKYFFRVHCSNVSNKKVTAKSHRELNLTNYNNFMRMLDVKIPEPRFHTLKVHFPNSLSQA